MTHNLKKIIFLIENKPWIVFIFFIVLIFVTFKSLFFSYFEADEWVHFTYYLPLAAKPNGFFISIISTFVNSGFLTGEGQHVNPIGTAIFFLNTKFFGLYYPPYAFMTLALHSLNSFLIFLLLKTFLYTKEITRKNIFALLGALFFALAPTPLHTITGAAPFYSYNVLSVTFFLLCIILFKIAFIKKQKKFIYGSIIFLFCALFSKETTAFLFLLLPLLILFEKRVFPFSFLCKIFVICIVIYAFLRFFLPNFASHQMAQQVKYFDNGTIVSTDISIHQNLPLEILFRTITFPFKMAATVFVPRQTVATIVSVIAPVIQPALPGGDTSGRMSFVYGAGNVIIIYLISIGILIFCIFKIISFIKTKNIQEAQALFLGIAIILLSALPLVAIIFSFPRWGYDFYFDSRHYYNPTVGAALVFPFLFFTVTQLFSRIIRTRQVTRISFALFILWFLYNFQILSANIKQFANIYSSDRREVVSQMRKFLPELAQKTVFYIETDGLSAYGPVLPFQTNAAQALSLVYYDKSPLPDSFFNKVILDGKSEGYQYADGRGFGYYTSKKALADALVAKQFLLDDLYAFYYEAEKVKLHNRTLSLRKEMKQYLEERKKVADWKFFEASPSATETISFSYPPDTEIIDKPIATTEAKLLKEVQINNSQLNASLKAIRVTPASDISETLVIFGKIHTAELPLTKKVMFDTYHVNEALVITITGIHYYLIKVDDLLISLTTPTTESSAVETIEKMLGSLSIIEKK